jgi:hypothetical protein
MLENFHKILCVKRKSPTKAKNERINLSYLSPPRRLFSSLKYVHKTGIQEDAVEMIMRLDDDGFMAIVKSKRVREKSGKT